MNDGEVKNMRMNNVVINGDEHVGGLVGRNTGAVSESYATGDVTGDDRVGGLLGRQNEGETIKSYADVSVTGNDQYAGGFIGQLDAGEVHNSYSQGDVSGDILVGGFASTMGSNAEVHNSYSTGSVSGTQFDFTFGFTESNGGEVTNSYWDSSAYSNDESEAESLSTNDMQGDSAEDNMNLDFNSIWRTVDNDYPKLQWQE